MKPVTIDGTTYRNLREGISRQRAQELADEPAFAALLAARRESA